MLAELVRLEVHLGLEDDKLLLEALAVRAEEMVPPEMFLERVVVEVVMRLPRVPPVTQETSLVLVAAVLVQLVAVVEARAAEAAQRMAPEARLVGGAGLVVAVPHMLRQLLVGKHVVLVREDLLMPSTEVAHLLAVDGPDMAMQIRPAEAGKVALGIGAVVPEEQHAVAYDILAGILDADVLVGAGDIGGCVLFETLLSVISEDDKWRGRLYTEEDRVSALCLS